MRFKFPKNDEKYSWTNHVGRKMIFYGLSVDRIKRVIRSPKRSEKGIAPDTIAVMQSAGTTKRPSEIWVMYTAAKPRVRNSSSSKIHKVFESGKKIIITAWRYPGVSPVRDKIPIPRDMLEELKREGVI